MQVLVLQNCTKFVASKRKRKFYPKMKKKNRRQTPHYFHIAFLKPKNLPISMGIPSSEQKLQVIKNYIISIISIIIQFMNSN